MEYLTHFKLQVHRFDTHTRTMFVVKEICGESVPVSQTSFNSIVNACCIAQHCVCVCVPSMLARISSNSAFSAAMVEGVVRQHPPMQLAPSSAHCLAISTNLKAPTTTGESKGGCYCKCHGANEQGVLQESPRLFPPHCH